MRYFSSIVLFIFCVPMATAEIKERDLSAAKLMSIDLAKWWENLPEPRPKSVAIASVSISSDMDPVFSGAIESLVLRALSEKQGLVSVQACFECRTPRVHVKDDSLVVTKGIPNRATLLELGKAVATESFMEIEVTRNGDSLLTRVTVVKIPSGEIYASEVLTIPDSALKNGGFELIVKAGLRFELNSKPDYPVSFPVPIGVDILVLDQITKSTKAGIALGATIFPTTGSFGYVMPTLAWRIQFGRTPLSLLPMIQGGIGIREGLSNLDVEPKLIQPVVIGATAGLGLDLYVSKNVFMGIDGIAFFPLHNFTANQIGLLAGFHVGTAFGL